jgi:hypothetical protein
MLTHYEQTLADALEARMGREWYYATAHPQTLRDYVTGDQVTRERALLTMKVDAIHHANQCLQAAISAGIVKPVQPARH